MAGRVLLEAALQRAQQSVTFGLVHGEGVCSVS